MSYIRNVQHIIFATKNRENTIHPSFQNDLYNYIGGIIKNNKGTLIAIGGIQNHVHILTNLHQDHSLSETVRRIKAGSSHWINEEHKTPTRFAWQTKYGAFSVSRSMEERVENYIRNQMEHHKKQSFQDEFIGLLKKHGIEYDEKYIWKS
jgi:REP element-mobilizing transposase RayT